MNRMDTALCKLQEIALSPRKCQSDSVDIYQQKTKNKPVGPKVKVFITNVFVWARKGQVFKCRDNMMS